jgi:hypothetical protein
MVFAASALSKLRSGPAYRAFASWLADLRLPVAGSAVAAAMAGTEVTVVALIALPWTAAAGLALAAAAAAVFAVGILVVVHRGTSVPCRCFGVSAAPLGRRHVARNAGLCLAAAAGAAGAGSAGARPPGIALSLGVAAVLAAFVLFADDLAELFTRPA